MSSKFIVLDGMDGSGKGTQISLLQEKLKDRPVLFTREPGGSPKAEEIRRIILQTGGPESNPACDSFLFWAARCSHIESTVTPAREEGKDVICDRYDSSTFAFQICGEESPVWIRELFVRVRSSMPKQYLPTAYIFLDLPAEQAYERRTRNTEQEKSKFDLRPVSYHERVRQGFLQFAKEFGRTHIIDADRTPQKIHEDLWKVVSEEFAR